MPNLPLAADTIHNGTIYLKGETEYGEDLVSALKEKAQSVRSVSDHPIFVPPSRRPPEANTFVQSLAGEEPTVLVVPAPAPPPAPPVVEDELPEDMPYRELLIGAGYDTLTKVEAVDDFKLIADIGPQREAEIQTYLAGLGIVNGGDPETEINV